MKNKKLIFIAGFMIGSLLFGFLAQEIGDMIYDYQNPPKEVFKYNSSNNWEDERHIPSRKTWEFYKK